MTDEQFLGLIDSPPDERDWPLAGAIADNPTPTESRYAPTRWPHYPKVDNQLLLASTQSACVAFSGATTRLITEKLADGKDTHFNQPELYKQCKLIDGVPNQPGTFIRAALQVLKNRGALLNHTDGTAITPSVYMPISGYVGVDYTQLSEIKKAIYYLGHCWAAIRWYGNWNPSHNPPAVMPKPGTYKTSHAIVFDAWDDSMVTWAGKGAVRFHNSFNGVWADQGDGWLPYQLIKSVVTEAWATFDVQEAAPPPPPPATPTDTAIGGDMPTLAKNLTGYTASVTANTNVRSGPTRSASVIRLTKVPEPWTLVGEVHGELVAGSDLWMLRFSDAGDPEYVHSSTLVAAPKAPCT